MLDRKLLTCLLATIALLGLLVATTAARPVSLLEARQVAAYCLNILPLLAEGQELGVSAPEGENEWEGAGPPELSGLVGPITDVDEVTLAYAFEITPLGFLVIGADTRLQPLVAFSVESLFPWEEDVGNALQNVLRFDLASRLEAVETYQVFAEDFFEARWEALLFGDGRGSGLMYASYGTMEEWDFAMPIMADMTLDWHQRSPFNDVLPLSEGHTFAAGCVAIALSQIIAYNGENKRVYNPCGAFLFPEMHSLSTWGELGRLAYCAGAFAGTQYGFEVSTASLCDAHTSLVESWDYRDIIRHEILEDTSEPIDAFDPIYNSLNHDMSERRPAILGLAGKIVASGWTGSFSNHAVVVDGWRQGEYGDATTFYHLRLGQLDRLGNEVRGWVDLPSWLYYQNANGAQTHPMPGVSIIEGIFNIQPLW